MRSIIALVFLACLVTSCDDAFIDPFNNDGRYYTIYGFLDALERNHEVRVIPVTRRGEKITNPENPEAQLDATVRSIDMLSGQVTTWRPSLEQLEDGTYAHIFRATFIVTAGATYRLEVERSDGIIAHAETTVPLVNTASLFERGPIEFSADSTVVTQDIFIPSVDSPWDIQTVYIWAAGPINRRIFVPYGRRGSRGPNGGWNMTMQVSADQIPVMENIEDSRIRDFENPDLPVVLSSMGVQLRILDQNWDPPEGEFDPELLADPDILSNVVNGYGFWGSIGLYREEWNACLLSEALGYAPAQAGC